MLALLALLAASTTVVDVPCKRSHDGYRCGDVEVHVDAHYATPLSAGHDAFRAKNANATARSEHEKGTDIAVDIAVDTGRAGRGVFKVFANRKREDDIVVDVTCDSKAKDSDDAWSKCSRALISVLFAPGHLSSSVIDRVETLWDLDHRGRIKCKGNDKSGSCDAITLRWGGAVDAGDSCVALGWPATCKPGDKGSWLARTAAGISFTCGDISKCGFLFGLQATSDAPASGGATVASSGVAGAGGVSSGANGASSGANGASSGANGASSGANGASSGASTGGASSDSATVSAGGSAPPEAGAASESTSLNADAEKSLVEMDQAYESDPQKNAHAYASAAFRAAEEARVVDRGLALGLARVVEHVDPSQKQACVLDDELAQKHLVRSVAELVAGGVVAVGGAVGGMALFTNKDQTIESVGVILGLIVTPPAVATAIIGGVGTYDELTKDVEPRLPKGLEHRNAWLASSDAPK
jgi:hypothetical protein